MVTGILIPHDTTLAVRKIELETLTDYQQAVGGYVEMIPLADHQLVIIANEEGKLRSLALNQRATHLWWLLNPQRIGNAELVGDVLLVGEVESEKITSAPTKLMTLLLESRHFQVQVLLSREFETWVTIGPPVDDFFEAIVRALKLMEVWESPCDVDVVAFE